MLKDGISVDSLEELMQVMEDADYDDFKLCLMPGKIEFFGTKAETRRWKYDADNRANPPK